jgi:hypothetical protein
MGAKKKNHLEELPRFIRDVQIFCSRFGFKLFSFAEIVSVVDNVCMDDTYLVIVLVWNLDTIICSVFQCKSFSLPKKGRKGEGNGRLVSYHPTTSVSLNTSMNNCLAFKC